MSQFVDECDLNVRGGDGGAGCVSFRREAHVARGGPDGGDGGNGGHVWLEADHNVASLLAFRDHPHRRADSGTHGSSKRKHGSSGDDLVVKVPVGTSVRLKDGPVVADLTAHGDRWLAAHAGDGGRGNARFLSNRHRAPSFAEQGEHGEERWLTLELKLLADVALVGFPNAGKSTLISRISAAKPKIADYPFTTLEPNLGVVTVDADTSIIVADIPGLIEGAAQGRGLGHQFLRHVERARVLVVMIDLAPVDGAEPAHQLSVLLDELGSYRAELLDRPRIVVGSRADVAVTTVAPDHLEISAVTGQGLDDLVGAMARAVGESRRSDETPTSAPVVHRPVGDDDVTVERDLDGAWLVRGRAAARAVALSDLTNPEALAYAQKRLKSLGVDKRLERAGARHGETVRIGAFEFTWADDDLVDGLGGDLDSDEVGS
ncbi:MAG: GTPase ObgE [Acidimicrobiales bacterium]